jgi:hypothetical protein
MVAEPGIVNAGRASSAFRRAGVAAGDEERAEIPFRRGVAPEVRTSPGHRRSRAINGFDPAHQLFALAAAQQEN